MKTAKFLMGAALAAGLLLSSCQGSININSGKVKLTNENDSISYAIGLSAGMGYAHNLMDFPVDVDKERLIKGFIHGLKGDTANYKISQDDLVIFFQAFFAKLEQEEAEKREMERAEAELRNIQILYENSQKEGVQETNSGLQYRVITEGKGKKPTIEDVVRVHYTGRLVDGTVFDSSIERGAPAEFPLGAVIEGWVEALQLMPVGSKWELAIPSELGYGDTPAGSIPANSVLFFDVELLEIVTPKK